MLSLILLPPQLWNSFPLMEGCPMLVDVSEKTSCTQNFPHTGNPDNKIAPRCRISPAHMHGLHGHNQAS